MYLNDLNSSQHNVEKLNRILADTFKHDVDLSQMSTDSLNRMLTTTNSKRMEIRESDLKYWENPQYNKLGLIAHQIKTYLSEIAPTRSDGKKMKKESTVMEADLDQAEVLLAAQELVDELQKMVEDVAEMQVQKLMPIVDAMKEQIGFDVAEAYNSSADAALGGLLAQMKTAKEAVENATLAARGEPVPGGAPVPTDMGMDDADMDPEAPMDADAGMETPDDFGGDETEAGEDNPVGRELKGESALADMEGKALAEKKFLESKDKLFKMVESGQMSQEHFINVINELDEGMYDDYIKPALKKGDKFLRHNIIDPAAKGVASVLDKGADTLRTAGDDVLARGLSKGADVARFVGDHAKIDDPYARQKYLLDPKFRKAHKLSKGNFGAPPIKEDPLILGIPQTSPKGPGMPKGDPLIHGTPKKRKTPMDRFKDADRRSSQRNLPNTPTPNDMARDRFRDADRRSSQRDLPNTPTPDDMGSEAPGMPKLTDPGSLLDPKRGPNIDAQGREVFPSIPKAGITGADRAPQVGDLRGGGQQGKITTYYGTPMVRPAPGGPGDLRPRKRNRFGGPFNPKGKNPRGGMRFAKVGNTPKG